MVGFGGYPTVPPLLAARLFGVPGIIHEANAVLGRANRFLSRRASAIATSFPGFEQVLAELGGQIERRASTITAPAIAPVAAAVTPLTNACNWGFFANLR